MKFLKLAILGIFILIAAISCRKNSNVPVTDKSSFYGVWVGKFGTGNNTPSSFFSFVINQDGTIEELDASGKAVGKGTWKCEYDVFTASWDYYPPSSAKYSAVADYNKTIHMLIGKWGYSGNSTDGGSWQMVRK